MKKEIGNVNQFEEASFLEIFYNDKMIKLLSLILKKKDLPNNISLSKLDEKSYSRR